ncbi:hypothetical protein L202_06106 [Cryptococcus amylolentus CBS 6039]|uniref:Protein PNS1 n=2 Tax=Cryptococcus amylolentus TaxID=104669 RepID=A0A1E3HKB1_9TREE|nr:hypothetical protein L202_06106 [Cryptococcus amylolentus CBS 6039]ODN76186.1 hypothetical protein L202_06106 [Cryptococcus amylolentus CBS 6039]ODN96328.1 hypothetical protein I350_08354 [Cryptococcus amylolentus CBS 6273]
MGDNHAGPSLTMYASNFLANKLGDRGRGVQGSQIFRPQTPPSPTHDPFIPSPSISSSNPHLAGSRSPSQSGMRTPPFPGPGIEGISDMDNAMGSSSVGVGVLFAGPDDDHPHPQESLSRSANDGRGRSRIPNPYESSSEDSDADGNEAEMDLDQVETVRRSLLRPHPEQQQRQPLSERAKKGWLAHQSVFPPSSSSSDDESDKETESESDFEESTIAGNGRKGRRQSEIDSNMYDAGTMPAAYNVQTNMEEPLLGAEDGDRLDRVPVRLQVYHGRFGHWDREGLRKYKDSGFLAFWLSSLLGILIGLLFVWGSTDPPPDAPSSAPSIIPLLPLLLMLLIPPLVLPPAFLFLLQKTVRPVLVATAGAIPFSLFICGWWAIGASFETQGLVGKEKSEQWWGTTALRIGAVLLWALAAWFGRLMWLRRRRLDRTASVVELSTKLLLNHPPLLILTPLLLGVFAIASIPFLTLLIRLGMIGYWRHPRENTWVFHIRPYAGWLIFLVTLIWVWTWGVIRGVGRVAVAGVIGEWYFHREDHRRQDIVEVTTAAVHRATGTSLGSICLGAGIIAVVRTVGSAAASLKQFTSPRNPRLPSFLTFLHHLSPVLTVIAGVLDQLNGYALVYVGITGDAFWPSARRSVSLAGRRKAGHLLDYTLIKLLLTLSSTAMGLMTATAGYLYMTHTLGNPGYAPVAGLVCGGVPFLAVRAGAGVLTDAADALFVCYQIDRELGGQHSEEAKGAFVGETPSGADAV